MADVLNVMVNAGYRAPQHYKVCVSSSHSFLLKSKAIHPVCPTCGKTGLAPENSVKNKWHIGSQRMNGLSIKITINLILSLELWHGRRFRELSWFWDSSRQYMLPEKCPHYLKIILNMYLQSNGNNTNLQCVHCFVALRYHQTFVHGRPTKSSCYNP